MLLDRNKYSESGYIGEELIGDAAHELEQRCMAVQQSVKDNDFPYEDALDAYQVTDEQYKSFIGEALNRNIFISLSGTTLPVNKNAYFEVYERMLLSYFSHPSTKLVNKLKKLLQEAKEIA